MTRREAREQERRATAEAKRAAIQAAVRRKREAQPLNAVLEQFLGASGLANSALELRVLRAWQEASGDRLSRRAKAVRFQEGELLVEVRSSAYLSELKSFTGEELRQRANARLRREAIQRVSFKLAR